MPVYVIRRKHDEGGLVKIGFTNNVERRLYDLATATPEGFDVLHTFKSGRTMEAKLHEYFAAHRVSREWFRLSAEQISSLKRFEEIYDEYEGRQSPIPCADDEYSENIVLETRFYLNELVKREWRGMGDTIEAARDRVMDVSGIDRSYGFRLWSKFSELSDVSGAVYRSLRLAYALALKAEGNINVNQAKFLLIVGEASD